MLAMVRAERGQRGIDDHRSACSGTGVCTAATGAGRSARAGCKRPRSPVPVSVSVPVPEPGVSVRRCLFLSPRVCACGQLLEPFFKSPSIEERLAATSVASSVCARMSADLQRGGEGGGSVGAEVLADARKEWESVAKALLHGLYLGMNDLGKHPWSRRLRAHAPRPETADAAVPTPNLRPHNPRRLHPWPSA